MTLNTPGASNGIFEFWIDDGLQVRHDNINWRDSYTGHGINAVFFENHWNSGPSKPMKRWFDDVVVSTERIGCE